jgi:hypothetical protein
MSAKLISRAHTIKVRKHKYLSLFILAAGLVGLITLITLTTISFPALAVTPVNPTHGEPKPSDLIIWLPLHDNSRSIDIVKVV